MSRSADKVVMALGAPPRPGITGARDYLARELGLVERRVRAYARAREEGAAVLSDEVAAVERARAELVAERRSARDEGQRLPLGELARRLDLGMAEEQALLIALVPHLSHRLHGLLVHAQGSLLKPHLEVGFVADLIRPVDDLLSDVAWLRPGGPLVSEGLLWTEGPREQSGPVGELAMALCAPHFLAHWLLGEDRLDASLVGVAELRAPAHELFNVILPPRSQRLLDELVAGFYRRGHGRVSGAPSEESWTLLVHGPAGSGKTALVDGLARMLEQPVLSVHLDRLPQGEPAARALRVAAANARVLGAVLHFVRPESLATRPSRLQALVPELSARHTGLVVLEAGKADAIPGSYEDAIGTVVPIERLNTEERQLIWESHLPDPHELPLGEGLSIGELAASFDLSGGKIRSALAWARRRALVRGEPLRLEQGDLEAGARGQLRARLGDFTDASEVRLSMTDLILPDEAKGQVEEFLGACRARHTVMNEWGFSQRLVTGKGLITLFCGEPGTGKTLCAEILAGELDLDLHIVSIPKVVSKWVGETEKNIQQVFSHARAQNSMLLFDEADSLFTKRVSVERSSDHFQNMEVNLLLQEIERFEGIVILTTNLATNLDKAFQRRISFKIDFPMPEAEQRALIWRSLIPAGTPIRGELDFDALADRFELSGGQIKNAVVRAAYRCASAGHGLDQEALEATAIEESKAAGKLVRAHG